MDLRWGFNNVRIKEGDEWKGAFTTYVGSFEPTVMFFGMTNSPAMFQAMMNKILRDLINEEKVAVFVDDVLVGTETEGGHDEIVEEILRRLEENDLYIKPEKCICLVGAMPDLLLLLILFGDSFVEDPSTHLTILVPLSNNQHKLTQ